MPDKEKKKMGRPPKQIDKEQFEKLCGLQCTEEEIAGWFKCSVDTVERWCKKEYQITFAEVYRKASADGKITLRRYQLQLAKTNGSVAIWLGKVWLGQRETEGGAASTDDRVVINLNIADCKGGDGNGGE
jgi:hypothetical protein